MPRFRKMIDVSIPFVGIAIVFLAVILISDFNLQARVLTVLVGILFIQAGVWKLTTRFLPSARDYTELRQEVDGFILLVRALNTAALEARDTGSEESWSRFVAAMAAMHDSVEHMAELAGKPVGGEPTTVPSLEA